MNNMLSRIIQLVLFSLFTVLFHIGDIHAFNLDIKNDKITLHADNVPLNDILKEIAVKGIAVYVDPEINPRISASFENIDIEKGLKSILKSLNHILVWESVADPLMSASSKRLRLSQIQIFRQGKKDLMIPIEIEKSVIGSFQEPETEAFSKRETKITIRGNLIFVPVALGYQGREIETTLILDTGSSSIVLHGNIANSLAIDSYSQSKAKGVGGIELETKMVKLDYVRIGPHKKTNLIAHVIEYEDPNIKQFNGLLGMNFLKDLKYSIDFDRQVLIWQQ